MTPEEKVFEKLRRMFIDDSTIAGFVEDRVYTAHISNIEKPVYPAISLFMIDSGNLLRCPTIHGSKKVP